jgi:hypothetical protein
MEKTSKKIATAVADVLSYVPLAVLCTGIFVAAALTGGLSIGAAAVGGVLVGGIVGAVLAPVPGGPLTIPAAVVGGIVGSALTGGMGSVLATGIGVALSAGAAFGLAKVQDIMSEKGKYVSQDNGHAYVASFSIKARKWSSLLGAYQQKYGYIDTSSLTQSAQKKTGESGPHSVKPATPDKK